MLILKFKPNIQATIKNTISCIIIIGINDIIYPKIKSLGFLGDVTSLIRRDELLSLAIKLAVNSVTKE